MMRVMMMFNVMMTKTNMFMTMEMMTIDQDIKFPERMHWVHFETKTEICQQSDGLKQKRVPYQHIALLCLLYLCVDINMLSWWPREKSKMQISWAIN